MLHTEYPDFQPPTDGRGQCLLVWDRHLRGTREIPEVPADVRQLAATLDVTLTGSEPVGVVEAPLRFDPRRVRRVHYILRPDGAGQCR